MHCYEDKLLYELEEDRLGNEIQAWFMFDMYIINAALFRANSLLLWRWWYITVLKLSIVILLKEVFVYFGIYLSNFFENWFILA
jgi:hypothetical protein